MSDDQLRFGDPIGCHYPHADPGAVASYAESVRAVGAKVGLAETAFRSTASIPEESFAGEAAESLRARASRRLEEADELGGHLRGVARAVADHAEFLQRHRAALETLRDLGASRGLRVESHRIWPPVRTISADASPAELDAWERDWKSYQECFEAKREIVQARQEAGRALVKAIVEHTGVRPADVRDTRDQGGHGEIDFGGLRREAAAEAAEAVAARDDLQAAQGTVDRLRTRYDHALERLEHLLLADAPAEQLLAQSTRIQLLDRELDGARAEVRDAADTFRGEQREADRAARDLQQAESGGPVAVVRGEPVEGRSIAPQDVPHHGGRPQADQLASVRDLRDRLG
jgi:hypothetical protein